MAFDLEKRLVAKLHEKTWVKQEITSDTAAEVWSIQFTAQWSEFFSFWKCTHNETQAFKIKRVDFDGCTVTRKHMVSFTGI